MASSTALHSSSQPPNIHDRGFEWVFGVQKLRKDSDCIIEERFQVEVRPSERTKQERSVHVSAMMSKVIPSSLDCPSDIGDHGRIKGCLIVGHQIVKDGGDLGLARVHAAQRRRLWPRGTIVCTSYLEHRSIWLRYSLFQGCQASKGNEEPLVAHRILQLEVERVRRFFQDLFSVPLERLLIAPL